MIDRSNHGYICRLHPRVRRVLNDLKLGELLTQFNAFISARPIVNPSGLTDTEQKAKEVTWAESLLEILQSADTTSPLVDPDLPVSPSRERVREDRR